LPEKLIHHIFKQLANAVAYLHRNGWIHGDLKEENIVLDEHYNAKLIDFGVARKVPKCESDFFGPSDYLGSISQVAPEILREQRWQGPLQDVWALGVILFALWFRVHPFTTREQVLAGEFNEIGRDECNDSM
ncbi:kinase-like domain-containing protein, partial [Cladochytrium replicatum]